DVPFFQASLSGYSDYAMRKLARCFGCPFTLTGVMLAKSMANPRVLRKACFRPHDDEHPVGAQILGKTPATMAQAAKDLVAVGYDLIDLNFACPAPKVLRRGRGGALLNDPDTVITNLQAVKEVVDCPVMMKLRMGVNHQPQSQENFWEIVTRAIENAIDALVIHGRTVTERYRGQANWDILAQVKQRFPQATIIGSGDVFDAATSLAQVKRTGLDGLIVARGAVGNPWLFQELRHHYEGKAPPPAPSLEEQREVILQQLDDVLLEHEERRSVGYYRKFIAQYARRHPERKQVVRATMAAKTKAELVEAIDTWYLRYDGTTV
ncbi:MAG: tRNA-dihydrouridine synthase, partial [Chlorobiales bacterium]|nr:tRNA-dihydrouridine synthase [Chlorobiales bacterium]